MKKIFILLFSTFLFSGCSYTELNDLAIASAVGIDYIDDKFYLTTQIMNIKSNDSGATKENTLIYEASGETIAKAVRNFSIRYPKNVYFGHLEFIVISEDAANKKLEDIFDYFMRAPEARTSGFVTIVKDKTAKEILNPKNEVKDSFPTEAVKSTLMDATKRNGTVNDITFEEFLSFYLKKGIDPVVPLIKNEENKGITASSTLIHDMVPIKKDKVLTPLSSKESIAYNLINNNFEDIIIDCKYDKKSFASLIYNPSSSVDVKINKNKITVNINVYFESKVREINSKVNLSNNKVNKKLKKQVNKEIESYINELINYSKENNVDILGIGNMIYKNYNDKYDKYKNINFYEEADFKIKVDNKMYRYGNINKGAA